ncbi:MAG: hypothetical protein ACTSWQ_00815 [Candidatus Thorarchaeota archaeon]
MKGLPKSGRKVSKATKRQISRSPLSVNESLAVDFLGLVVAQDVLINDALVDAVQSWVNTKKAAGIVAVPESEWIEEETQTRTKKSSKTVTTEVVEETSQAA